MTSSPHIRSALRDASRVGSLSHPGTRVSAGELAVLGGLGALAAWATVGVQLRLGVPGHAILRGVLPMALGLSLVPRRGAGSIMGLGAGLTAAGLALGQIAPLRPAEVVGVTAIGPLLDVLTARGGRGWRLYAQFLGAGLTANLLAFVVRYTLARLGVQVGGGAGRVAGGWGAAGGGLFPAFAQHALLSYALCGAAAGLVSGLACFRAVRDDDDRSRASPR